MTEADIANAIGQRLSGGTALPIVWPNKAADPVLPYLVCDVVPVSRRSKALTGGGVVHSGYAMISVVAELDQFETTAISHAETVAALFPAALRFAAGTGTITIMQPPTILRGYPDDASWRKPVRIEYQASA